MEQDYDKIIEQRAQHVFDVMSTRVSSDEVALIRKAFKLARKAHAPQKRKTGEPYILHPIAVATIAAEELALSSHMVMAAFLHDVVEDTDYTIDDISREFGDDVAFLVNVVTKQKKEKYVDSLQVDNFRQMHLHRTEDLGSEQGHFAPAVILLSDGAPNDNFEKGYKKLSENPWFKSAAKIAIAIGTEVDNKVLCKFVGEDAAKEAVLTVHDAQSLKDIIRLVSCSVSRHGSAPVSTDNKSQEELLVEDIKSGLKDMPNETTYDKAQDVIDVKPLGDDLFD